MRTATRTVDDWASTGQSLPVRWRVDGKDQKSFANIGVRDAAGAANVTPGVGRKHAGQDDHISVQ